MPFLFPWSRVQITFRRLAAVLSWRVYLNGLEDDLNKSILFAIAALALLAGCGPQNPGIPVKPKFSGPPYHLALGAPPAKASKAGITIPQIKYTADPNAPEESLDKRAVLVVRIDTAGLKSKGTMAMNQIIMGAVDLPGADGALSAGYLEATDQSLATLLEEYCVKGKVKITVSLARSTLSTPPATPKSTASASRTGSRSTSSSRTRFRAAKAARAGGKSFRSSL